MIGLHVDILSNEVDRNLRALEVALAPQSLMVFHEMFTRNIIRERMQDRFDRNGDEMSGPWAQLSDARQDIRSHAGLFPTRPINVGTGELRDWLEGNRGSNRPSALGAMYSFPGAIPRRQSVRSKYETAQKGKAAGFPMPDGHGGTKPSPSPTPPRPIVGLDALDLIHVLGALQLYIVAEVAKYQGP